MTRRLLLLLLAGALVLTGCTPDRAPDPVPTRTTTASPAGTDRYVDCRAPAGGVGTRARPWNTVEAIAVHGAFAPGDRILLARGSRCTGRIVPTGSGTSDRPILLGAYGSGAAPVVDGGGTPDQTGTVQLADVHDWIVQDLVVTNLDPAGPDNTMRAGVLVVNDRGGVLPNVTVRRVVVRRVTSSPGSFSADPHEFGGIVVLTRATAGAGFEHVRIEDSEVDHVGRTGIAVWSRSWPGTPTRDVAVTGNAVRYAEGDSIVLWGVEGGVVERNTSGWGGRLPACPRCTSTAVNTANAGIWPVSSRRILIRYNEVWGEGVEGGDGEGFDIDDGTDDVVLEGNLSRDNDGGGVLICGARNADVRFNVLSGNRFGEIVFSCPEQRDGVRILHNTIRTAPGSGTAVVRRTNTAGTAPIVFANNVVLNGSGGGYDWPSPVQATSNLFSGATPATEPADATALRGDAGLTAPGTDGSGLDSVLGYRPAPGSPAIASGAALLPEGATDYLGRAVDAARPDRGAFGTASAVPPTPAAVVLTAVRQGTDVALTWPSARGTAYRLSRTDASGAVSTTGLLTRGAFADRGAPAGTLRYRLVLAGRDRDADVGGAAVR